MQCRRPGFHLWVRKIPWRRESYLGEGLPTPEFLPREFHGQRSLASYSPWGHKEPLTPSLWGFAGGASGKEPAYQCRLDIRDVSTIPGSGRSPGVGHGNPLQYSCLENPMDRGAWQAAVHRVAQSWTQLKRFSCMHGKSI